MSRTNYNKIYDDLYETDPTLPMIMPIPYDENLGLVKNVETIYQYLIRTLKRGERISALVNAYYLMSVINNRSSSNLERALCCSKLSQYYLVSCKRIYDIFEPLGIEQIYRTKQVKVVTFFRITKPLADKLIGEATALRISLELEN